MKKSENNAVHRTAHQLRRIGGMGMINPVRTNPRIYTGAPSGDC